MNFILNIPLPLRLALLFAAGAAVAGWLNLAIFRFGWTPRSTSPWSRDSDPAFRRTWLDKLPLIGWLRLRREAKLHGAGFWVRPLLIELGTGLAFAGLYAWEVNLKLIPGPAQLGVAPPAEAMPTSLAAAIHAEYFAHIVLLSLMIVATFIDIDDKIIPDGVTVPGTLAGLLLATVLPWSLLPAESWLAVPPGRLAPNAAPPMIQGLKNLEVDFLRASSPNAWPRALEGAPRVRSLAIALGCWGMWCFAILPRRWSLRRGLSTALRIFFRGLRREAFTLLVAGLAVFGAGAIAVVWSLGSRAAWAGLLSALIGLAASGGLIWIVRIIGTLSLGREAMGFGDVTLMAMIGAFLGWQASLMIFFLAPFAGLVIGVAQWIVKRDQEIPYGPFLCLAALVTIVRWRTLWESTAPVFGMGWLVPGMMAACMLLMAVLLTMMRFVRERFERRLR